MSNVLRFRLVAVLFLVVSMHVSLLPGQIFRNLPRRVERQPVAPSLLSVAEAKVQLQRLANEIKENPRRITENDQSRSQRLLRDAVNDLQRRLPREFDRETANDWSVTFQLAELSAALGQPTPNAGILEAVQHAFYSDKEGVRWTVFDKLHTALRRHQTIVRMLRENSYERQLTHVCNNLVDYIETYSEGRNPVYFVTLSEAVAWLDDISLIEPRAARLAELTRIACSGVNVRLHVGSALVAAGFRQDINEDLDINEMILGTRVVGGGTLSGTTSAELVNSPNRAAIRVLAEGMLNTNTDGSQAMVTLKNHTTGTLRGEKQIIFSAEAITTTPARARANLNAQVSDVRINAGPIVRLVARSQIDNRREETQAEAARRAERRMSTQMNDRIDPNIAELNERYQKIRGTLNKTGLFPRVWNLSSTPQHIHWSFQLGNTYQPTAPTPAPSLQPTNGLAVQVHQSALNNMLAIALAGRMIDEEKFSQRIGEFFDEPPAFLQRKSEETPAKVSFGTRAPVDVLFVDNKIRVVVRLNDIQVMDNLARSFTITVEYQIKREQRDGRNIIILEQVEAEAFPAGYDPRSGATLSAAQTVIRSYLLRRLETLQKHYEAQPLELGGEWSGEGQLIPQFASAEKGWLTLVWEWE
jgi:hypothetical protein